MSGKTIEEVGDRYDGDVLGDDLRGVRTVRPESAGQPFATGRDGGPGRGVIRSGAGQRVHGPPKLIDVLIHGWDLAVATGQDSRLDPDLVEICWEIVRPQLELLQGSGAFGTEVIVPDDADSRTRLLAVLGRSAP